VFEFGSVLAGSEDSLTNDRTVAVTKLHFLRRRTSKTSCAEPPLLVAADLCAAAHSELGAFRHLSTACLPPTDWDI
jgi:hypothetical protein